MKRKAWLILGLVLPVLGQPLSLLQRAQKVFAPLPQRMDEKGKIPGPALIELGRTLFYEKRLSQNNTMSCNSCHDLRYGFGADGRPTSPGAVSGRGTRNAPTVYHAALHSWQFWDGRSPTVESQAGSPLTNPVEMAMPDGFEVEKRLLADPGYRRLFAQAFPGDPQPVRYAYVMLAIGAFERGLVTPAPFDRYLEGDETALDSRQLKGLEHFLRVGCAECHHGAALGGTELRKLGRKEAFASQDRGRFLATHAAADDGVFKVPSLRNVCETGPYYHNGQVRQLEEAVALMGRHECGQQLTPQEVAELCDFLTSLTGEIPKDYVRSP
ncbi:MAG: cytochrome-c peroxidase [Candidatus Eremiobacteraeota bacterium]|nr:cytochrome-c peroxidase [Candidatus Eremiobacteraeota bacterium]MCW5868435.1 cytochrome-c peroxidase [Candidatus Eremiobacteraeota bacterium]